MSNPRKSRAFVLGIALVAGMMFLTVTTYGQDCGEDAVGFKVTEVSTPEGNFSVEVCVTTDPSEGLDTYRYTVNNIDHCGLRSFAVARNENDTIWQESSREWTAGVEPTWWIWEASSEEEVLRPGQSGEFIVQVAGPVPIITSTGTTWPATSCASDKQTFETLGPGNPAIQKGVTRDFSLELPETLVPMPFPEGPEAPFAEPESMVSSYDLITGEETVSDIPVEEELMPSSYWVEGGAGESEMEPQVWPESNSMSWYTLVPYPTVGRYPCHVLLCAWKKGSKKPESCGSGTLIDPKTVLTAGHCIHKGRGGTYYDFVTVHPAYDQGTSPYGLARSVKLHTWVQWAQDGKHESDMGAIILDRPIGALTGWRGYGYNTDCDYFEEGFWEGSGYPGGTPWSTCTGFDMSRMYTRTGDFSFCNVKKLTFLAESCEGSSGTGFVRDDAVFGVLSFTRATGTDCPRITKTKFKHIEQWIAKRTPSTFDLIPLGVNVGPKTVIPGQQVKMVYLVHNYSSQAWSGTLHIYVYLSDNAYMEPVDIPIQHHTVSCTINPKSSKWVTASPPPTIPANTPEGTYYIGVVLHIADHDYSNNYSDEWDACAIATILAAPTGLTATAVSSSQIDSAWQDNSSSEAAFEVWRKVGVGGTYSLVDTVITGLGPPSFSDTGLIPNTKYCYRVRGVSTFGGESAYSNTACVKTLPPCPSAPSNLVASVGSPTHIYLVWQDNSDEECFRIYCCYRTNGIWTMYSQVGIVPTDDTSYTHTNLIPNAEYCYQVRASNATGESGPSNEACADTSNAPPLPPSGLTAKEVSPGRVDLKWDDNSGNENCFLIERDSEGSGFIITAAVGQDVTSYTDGGLDPHKQYCYRVMAHNIFGDSGASDVACIITSLAEP